MENADLFIGLNDFLERMRRPSAADFVKSIKSFIVSFSNNAPDPDRDSAAVQEFFAGMEAAFRAHPLWASCSDEELGSAGEGLEKYVMTKLFKRVFASFPDDVKVDGQLSDKMALIQQFIRPENLDIKPTYQNETSWLLAQKELQKINMFRAPRDKLVCVLNCCRIINNLLLNASIASNENPPGADEFLPVLIYVTIKANPPQLHSNLLYIQWYRRQSQLVSEAAYFFTNMLSAESFILNIDAKALSMDETEYETNMKSSQAILSGLSTELATSSNQGDRDVENESKTEPVEHTTLVSKTNKNPTTSPEPSGGNKEIQHAQGQSMKKVPSVSELENKGATELLKDSNVSQVFLGYPYFFADVGDLTVTDVKDLLNKYKQLVFRCLCLCKGLDTPTSSIPLSDLQHEVPSHAETMDVPKGPKVQSKELQKDTCSKDVGKAKVALIEGKDAESKSSLEDKESKSEHADEGIESKLPQDHEKSKSTLGEESSESN